MAQLQSQSAADALNWTAAASNIERFNKPMESSGPVTYGFKGFPDNSMIHAKLPLRYQRSADVNADVNRYFRKDSPTEQRPQPFQPPPRMPSPPPQKEWLQTKRDSPPPEAALQQTISPRYNDEPSLRKPPVIFDPRGELTSAEKRKKIDEHYVAEEDLAMARRRKEKEKFEKIEEQKKVREMQQDFQPYGLPGGGAPTGDNRKMKFTEHQLTKNQEPKYSVPQGMRYGDEPRGMDRRNMPDRREDELMHQEEEISELRRDLRELERHERLHHHPEMMQRRFDPSNNKMDMLHEQASKMRHLEEEIDRLKEPHLLKPAGKPTWPVAETHRRLKAQDDMAYRHERPYDGYPRAQSEPQTDRGFRRHNRDRDIFGQSKQSVPDYLNVSPRRHPVGKLYNKDSTYTTDFDVPFGKHGSRNLGNPNKEPMDPYNPFGQEGGGAPMVDASGQRRTRIAGSMDRLGREMSDSARARKAHKRELLQEIGEQAAFQKAQREKEKAYYRQQFVEVADSMRQKKVGYPRFNPNGLISEHHHLPHMFNTNPYTEKQKQKQLGQFLDHQIEERNQNFRLGQMESKRQEFEHMITQDSYFGRRGGGNIKGPDPRKVNLDKAIHNPQSTLQNYMP